MPRRSAQWRQRRPGPAWPVRRGSARCHLVVVGHRVVAAEHDLIIVRHELIAAEPGAIVIGHGLVAAEHDLIIVQDDRVVR